MSESSGFIGPDALSEWRKTKESSGALDVVLVTHPRDENDLPRLFPWSVHLSTADRFQLTRHMKPVFGEIVTIGALRVGILFLPFYADELIDASARRRCGQVLEVDAIAAAAETGAKVLCLGGLTGALSLYGHKLVKPAEQAGIVVTTGHAVTSISVLRTYEKAVEELGRRPAEQKVTVIGVGSIGRSFAQLLSTVEEKPGELVLVDRPQMSGKLDRLAEEFRRTIGLKTSFEITDATGALPADSSCYSTDVLVSAVSTAYVVDIDKVAPGTILIDDSQPYCWSREGAWRRVVERADIVPCEAGLVDCRSIGFRSRFPFDFAEVGADGSSTAWSCLTEGMIFALEPGITPTIGEPTPEMISAYMTAFDQNKLCIPALQCGPHVLPIDKLRAAIGKKSS
ncbi:MULTISPECIES: hypothetical protein [unclassified Frankia]|uniref:hypothetical protein n=1 Tax=unclassified Frankia TaxID=2632575 RepID=UPI001EF41342|nr:MULTISPECIES: hypothetical protein [unclassified Frankia]